MEWSWAIRVGQLFLVSLRDGPEETLLHAASRMVATIFLRVCAVGEEIRDVWSVEAAKRRVMLSLQGILVLLQPVIRASTRLRQHNESE